jgi:hypothetical protein
MNFNYRIFSTKKKNLPSPPSPNSPYTKWLLRRNEHCGGGRAEILAAAKKETAKKRK